MATATKAPEQSVSFGDLSKYTSGYTLPEADYVWKDLTVMMFAGETKAGVKKGPARLGVMITLAPLSNPADDHTQFYSLGSKAHESFAPRSDGKGMVVVPGGPGGSLNNSTNWSLLLKSLYDCGLPPGVFDDDLSVFDGMHVHMANVPEPEERKGFASTQTGEAAEERKSGTVLVVTEIKDDGKPWEGSGGVPEGAQAQAKPAGKAPAKAPIPIIKAQTAPADDIQTVAVDAISKAIMEKPEGMPKLMLRTSTFKAIANKEVANTVLAAYFSKDDALNGILGTLGYKLAGTNVVPA